MIPEQAAIDRGDNWTAEQERRRRLDQQGGTSWLDDLARNSLAAAEAKFGREPAPLPTRAEVLEVATADRIDAFGDVEAALDAVHARWPLWREES